MSTSSNFGSMTWGLQTRGVVSFREKINYILKASATKIALQWRRKQSPVFLDIDAIRLPDSALVWSALAYAKEVHDLPLVHHCLRAYVLGVVFATQEKIQYDPELYALAALLHDLGLEEKYCSMHCEVDCFALEGAQMARKWLGKQEIVLPEAKIDVVEDAIARHLNVSFDRPFAEAYLLNKAAGTDTIGVARHEVHDRTVAQLLERYPFDDMHILLDQKLRQNIEKRPKSRAALLYQLGFRKMLHSTPMIHRH